MFSKVKANPQFYFAKLVVNLFLAGVIYVSFGHIVDVSIWLGLESGPAHTVPFLIDGIALVGKAGMSERFSTQTHRAGFQLVIFGGLLSLAANVGAGHNWGQRAYGALLVAGFLLLEQFSTKLKPAAPVKTTSTAPVPAATNHKARQQAGRLARAVVAATPGITAAGLVEQTGVSLATARTILRQAAAAPGFAPVAELGYL